MARTMVANLTGARLREVDQALRDARGAAAVDALMNAHPHEAKILQHLFDERRAGRPGPALGRIARVMIWSDGAMEFRLVDIPTTGGALQRAVENAPMTVGGRQGLVSRGSSRGPRSGEFVGGRRAGGSGRPERGTGWTQGEPNGAGNRGEGASRPQRGVQPGDGAPRLRTAWFGGARLDPTPRQYRRRPGEDDDVNWGTAPRAGDGWSVVRPGDVVPLDPGDPPVDAGVEDSATRVHASRPELAPTATFSETDVSGIGVQDQSARLASEPSRTQVIDSTTDTQAIEPDEGEVPAGTLSSDQDGRSLNERHVGLDIAMEAVESGPTGTGSDADLSFHGDEDSVTVVSAVDDGHTSLDAVRGNNQGNGEDELMQSELAT